MEGQVVLKHKLRTIQARKLRHITLRSFADAKRPKPGHIGVGINENESIGPVNCDPMH